MSTLVTASLLYDLVQCPTRPERDLFEDPSRRDPASPFVEMLWRRGSVTVSDVVRLKGWGGTDLSALQDDLRAQSTIDAIRRGDELIVGGLIRVDDLSAEPDVLRLENSGYIPLDIRSGRGSDDDDDNEVLPRLHYAVQIGLYVDALERVGFSAGRRGIVVDALGFEQAYDLSRPRNGRSTRTLWDEYVARLATARLILDREVSNAPALTAFCKLCHWYSACLSDSKATDDLTLIPGLGRSIRDEMRSQIPTVELLAKIDLDTSFLGKPSPFKGIRLERLKTFQARALLLKEANPTPYLKRPLSIPKCDRDIFLDVEVDPLRDFTYLHGALERRAGEPGSERFYSFLADDLTPEAERGAFANAIEFLRERSDATIWYYSKYERTQYRKLQRRYPDICSEGQVEALFRSPRGIDLYGDVVIKDTEWPTNDYSIKTLANYLGFWWRAEGASSSASIEWFDQWSQTADANLKKRIIEYNEDDCRAAMVLLDQIRSLKPIGPM